MTGDEKYETEYRKLLDEHGYADLIRRSKTFAPAWRTHIDDELLALVFPALMFCEEDPVLLSLYRESLDRWYQGIKPDKSPFFNFLYGSFVGRDSELNASVAFLRDAPLDLVNWRIDNTQREDLRLLREPELDTFQTHPLPPVDERGVVRWDKNPWMAAQGDGGRTEWCPVYWLLPYWMGRYYGFIDGSDL